MAVDGERENFHRPRIDTVHAAGTDYVDYVRLLRHVVIRGTALGVAGLSCILTISGCAQFDKAFGQQQVDVYFAADVSVAFKLKVRAACNNIIPDVKAEPISKGIPLSSAVDVVVYNTTGASATDITLLGDCVSKFQPETTGMIPIDSSDEG